MQNNLSRESIERNISGGEKDPANMEQCEFEVYGPNGIQVIIAALTDNKNRTIANINGYLAKFHGTMAKTNSVKIFFENAGYIVVEKTVGITLDEIME
jgi:transcriptional/translational regulatory protein YebC/TACO1